MTTCVVLDIETRVDRLALAASGRSRAPSDMPAALQRVTAVALLRFERDELHRLSGFRLTSHAAEDGREADAAAVAERELALVHARGGELITFNGQHDLGVLRLALLRARILGGGGVAAWLDASTDRHRDLMREVSRGDRWPRLSDVAAGLGFAPAAIARTVEEAGSDCAKAEVDVALTALLAMHVDAERHGDARTLARALLAFGRFLGSRSLAAPHLGDILKSRLYAAASRGLAAEAG